MELKSDLTFWTGQIGMNVWWGMSSTMSKSGLHLQNKKKLNLKINIKSKHKLKGFLLFLLNRPFAE